MRVVLYASSSEYSLIIHREGVVFLKGDDFPQPLTGSDHPIHWFVIWLQGVGKIKTSPLGWCISGF